MLTLKADIFRQFDNIVFGFSTKTGLNRSAPYHFNLSLSVGDEEAVVVANRRAFYAAQGLRLESVAMQKQIHEDGIREVHSPGYQGESDAMITKMTGIGLAVSTADCVPVFIYCSSTGYIAAIHSGWRSTEKEITRKTVARLINDYKCNPEKMFVYIAPSISQKNFQVGIEVAEKFPAEYSYKFNEKYQLDLTGYNKHMLLACGIPEANIQVTRLCSVEQKELFHSYRREGFTSGRAYGVIYLKNKEI
ncbi:MAG: peptidoglycan editing factor PgeF [Ignavibacteriales bacterium]|nr:peptidoglycan editing factor PgeF [Ignavibacteriales bacterium]